MSKETLGVIGGLGPMATAHFMTLVTEMTDAPTDQAHLNMILYSAPAIPDRTAYILDSSQPDPFPEMLALGRVLEQQGVSRIAIPCVTAHYFFDRLEDRIGVPLINGVRETVNHLKEHGVERAGIMATSGTIAAGIFSKELENAGIQPVIPGPEGQAHIMHLIFQNIKAGKPPEMARFATAAAELRNRGAQAIILGCTELSLIKRDHPLDHGFIDAMEVLAQQSVLQCGLPLKESCRRLIT